MSNVGVFLDRDGTIIEEVDFLRTPDKLRLIDGAADAIGRLNAGGIVTCVISNQSGVARGYFTESDLQRIHERLKNDLQQGGACLDRIYYCPHYPDGMPPYNIMCDCRKPKPGMILQGIREFGLDAARSFVVGDRAVDVLAARAAGASAILVLTGYGKKALDECTSEGIIIDYVAETIGDAVTFIFTQLQERA